MSERAKNGGELMAMKEGDRPTHVSPRGSAEECWGRRLAAAEASQAEAAWHKGADRDKYT